MTFHSISASYEASSPPVLHDIDIRIMAGEKIGICGRTGSGKSTLIGILFRLLPDHTGTIIIDDQDLSSLLREDIRSSIITIPQEPFLLSGRVRFNAAPRTANISSEEKTNRIEPPETLDMSTSAQPEPVSDEAIIHTLQRVSL